MIFRCFIFILLIHLTNAFPQTKTIISTNYRKKNDIVKKFYNPQLFKDVEFAKKAKKCHYYPPIEHLDKLIFPLEINYIYQYNGKYSFLLNKIKIQEIWNIEKDKINCLITSKYFDGNILIFPIENNLIRNIDLEVDLELKKKKYIIGNDLIKEINNHIFNIISVCVNTIGI